MQTRPRPSRAVRTLIPSAFHALCRVVYTSGRCAESGLRLVVLRSPASGKNSKSRQAQGQREDGLDGLRQSVALRLFGAGLIETGQVSLYRRRGLLLSRLLRFLREAVSVGTSIQLVLRRVSGAWFSILPS